ncbi:MAG TPA: LptF/LptG family permease [Aestuariivirgaceae bacterium]|nr:LptF/LptG family permease [Aestuariivirgaceae bacterium]
MRRTIIWLPVVDRYVLRRVATPLLTAMAIGLLVLMADRMVRLLEVTLGKKNSFAVVFELLGYLIPHYLGLALPAAMFLGLLFGFNKMSKDSEIDAFLAAGIGLHRLVRPVVVLSLVLAIAALGIFGWMQPHGRYAYRAVMFNVKNVEVFYLAEEGAFMQAGRRTFILDELSRSTNSFERIFLFEDGGASGSETVTAARGALIQVPDDPRPVLRLEDGHRLQIGDWPEFGSNAEPPAGTVASFRITDTPLGRVSSKLYRPRGDDERELTLPELGAALADPPATISLPDLRSEFHKRLVNIASILVLPFLALPFAIGRRRGQRAYRFGIAMVVLIGYHEIIEQGALMTRLAGVSPWLTMWLPFIALCAFAAWRFRATCFLVNPDGLEWLVERLAGWMAVARARLGAWRKAAPS